MRFSAYWINLELNSVNTPWKDYIFYVGNQKEDDPEAVYLAQGHME